MLRSPELEPEPEPEAEPGAAGGESGSEMECGGDEAVEVVVVDW